MDKAILIEDIDSLDRHELSDFSYIYFGNETCPKLFSSLDDIKYLINNKKIIQKKLVLITSYLRDEDFIRVDRVFKFLLKKNALSEVVANDWGLIYFLNRNYPDVRITLGRLLTLGRIPRSPQLSYYYKKARKNLILIRGNKILFRERMSQNLYEYLYSGNLNSEFQHVLLKKGINCISIDNIPWLSLRLEQGVEFDLYYPYILMSVTRYCQLFFNKRKPFYSYIEKCNYECKKCIYLAKNRFFRKVLIKRKNAFYIRRKSINHLILKHCRRIVLQPGFI